MVVEPLRVLVSSCLAGNEVRYDGTHRRDHWVSEVLAKTCELVPHCPEVAIGLGVPRPPIQMVAVNDSVRIRRVDDPTVDVTSALRDYGVQVARDPVGWCGCVLKKGSPSCGVAGVGLFDQEGELVAHGSGMFATVLAKYIPGLPMEDEATLQEPQIRESFIERLFAFYRWQHLKRRGLSVHSLTEFHRRYKFILAARDDALYRSLGQGVAGIKSAETESGAREYITEFMRAMRSGTSAGKHANVLMHLFGFIKNDVSDKDKRLMLNRIEACGSGDIGFMECLETFRTLLSRYPNEYVEQQYYIDRDPRELVLRSVVERES